MAVTGEIFKTLTFGNVNSGDYGIYITGEAVYNAPKRAVDMVNVPGRNGAIALDQGRWENIDVTYPAGTFGDDQTEFSEAISAFRNAIASQLGYKRLSDDYHPGEYRMGLYVDGLDVKPVINGKGGEFDIRFNCKPQRWLASGEQAVTVDSGDTVTNPTLYEASPVFEVSGYGTIEFNGYSIDLADGSYGNIELNPAGAKVHTRPGTLVSQISVELPFSSDMFNAGDTFTVGASSAKIILTSVSPSAYLNVSISQSEAVSFAQGDYGTRNIVTKTVYAKWGSGASDISTYDVQIETRYTSTGKIFIVVTITHTSGQDYYKIDPDYTINYGALSVYSTKTYLGDPTYIDCDLGECYAIENGTVIDLNAYVDLGSDLPKLAPGANEITFDNTITSLKVTPGWWQL